MREIVAATLEQSFAKVEDDGAPVRPLSLVGNVITGRTPSTNSPVNYGGKLPFVTPSDFDHGALVGSSGRCLTHTGAKLARVVPAGSTFATCIGATLGKIGLATVTSAFNQQLNAVIPYDDVEPKYLFYALMRPKFINQMWGEASNTTLPIINKKRFSQMTVPVPLPVVQREVADHIDLIRSRVDSLSHTLESGYKRVAQLRRAILSDAFSGKLVGQDPNDEPASVLLERIRTERALSNGHKTAKAHGQGRRRAVA
jgi:type I restriction enzyme S subunit